LAVEIEIKVRIAEPFDVSARSTGLEARLLQDRHFEDNWLMDFPDASLRLARCLLRVRSAGREAYLTYKGPPQESSTFKIREELEVRAGDAALLVQLLERIGMRCWFRYQKYRTEYQVASGGSSRTGVRLAMDETPIGTYVELEGSEEGIREVARGLGFDPSAFLKESYYALYIRHCQELGIEPGHMVFGGAHSADPPPQVK